VGIGDSKETGASGPCRTCGNEGGGRYCSRCGSALTGSDSSGDGDRASTHHPGPWRPARGRRWRIFGLGAIALVVAAVAVVSATGFQRVPSSGICFANPLDRTSLWPYNPSTGVLSLRYYAGPPPETTYAQQYQEAARHALEEWSEAWPVIRFVRVSSPAQAQILIRHSAFGTHGFWYDHAGLTVPIVNVLGCGLSRAIIEINDSYLVHDGLTQYGQPMLRHLLLHEIGHALGLKHVYKAVPSVMVPTSDAYRYVKPQPYDILTISRLYPLPQRRHGHSTEPG